MGRNHRGGHVGGRLGGSGVGWLLLLGVGVAAAFGAGCPTEDKCGLYETREFGPGIDEAAVREMSHLGPEIIETEDGFGVNFGVFSGNAERVDLLVFDDPESSTPTRSFEMKRHGDVWNIYVCGVREGTHYGYRAWGPNWPWHPDWVPGNTKGFIADVDAYGHRYNPNKLLLDPYAQAIHRDHDWSKGSVASGHARGEVTYGAAAKSIVVKSQYEWSEHEATWRENRQNPDWEGHGWQDLIVYEVHPKGFTADSASGVDHHGTFRGFGEKADYLKELGVTVAELMPVTEKPLDGGYWGYNNLSFFAPEYSYSADKHPERAAIIDEFKWMVDQLHQRGIEVWIDVVYNHTGEGGLWREKLELAQHDAGAIGDFANFDPKEIAGLFSYRGLDNASYYALESSDPGYYLNHTGVGNTTRANYRPMRKLIMDSLRFMVEELHVDGFRFDLAPVLGEQDQSYEWGNIESSVLQEIVDDPVMQKYSTRFVAEPWAAYWGGFRLGEFPIASNATEGDRAWYEWNANFRDFWRSFINDDNFPLNRAEGPIDAGGSLTGSKNLFGDDGRRPYHAVNFITVHDGFTLYDLFSYSEKQNGCSPLNPWCCTSDGGGMDSPFCQPNTGEDHNRSRVWGDEATKRQMMRNAFAAILISHGTPMIYSGDEWMRTQLGNNNAYTDRADNPYNWLQWGSYIAQDERWRMYDFVKDLIRFRKEHAYAFAPERYDSAAPFSWKNAGNDGEPNWSGKHLAIHYYDASVGPELYILLNMEGTQVDFTLPGGRTWTKVVDTQRWFDDTPYFEQNQDLPTRESANINQESPEVVPGAQYGVQPRSIVILEAAP